MQPSPRQGDALLRAAIFSGPLFLGALLTFAALTPGFSHAHKSVSELGAFGMPWGAWFNLTGFLLPGLLATAGAWEFRRRIREGGARRSEQLSATGLVASMAMMALTAVPADMSAKFASPWTCVHLFFAMGSAPLFFTVIHGCARGLATLGVSPTWRRTFTFLGYLPIAEFFLYLVLPSTPGWVQRLMILTVHGAIASLCWGVLRSPFPAEQTSASTATG